MEENKPGITLPGIQTVAEDIEDLEKAYLEEGIKIGILYVARRMIEKDHEYQPDHCANRLFNIENRTILRNY